MKACHSNYSYPPVILHLIVFDSILLLLSFSKSFLQLVALVQLMAALISDDHFVDAEHCCRSKCSNIVVTFTQYVSHFGREIYCQSLDCMIVSITDSRDSLCNSKKHHPNQTPFMSHQPQILFQRDKSLYSLSFLTWFRIILSHVF